MYEAFYGLTEKPFNLTPDPRFLYLSDKHKEAFAHLLFGIKNRSGFVMVTGQIGTGKTTICRTLLSQLDTDTEVAFIFNPCLSPDELLRKINEDFGIQSQAGTIKGLVDELNEYLLDQAARGKNCVLVIDEAQNLTPQVLEQIRLLSNLETETQKLLQIVLIGQPELAQSLALPELRQLNQRISARYHLKPLNRDETLQYIAYRLRVAGGRRKIRFSRGAVRSIFRFSGGTPRVINAVCDRALLIGYTREVRDITRSIIRRAAREIRGERFRSKKPPLLLRYIPSPTFVGAAALIVIAGAFVVQAVSEFAAGTASPSSLAAEPPSAIQVSISEVAEAAATAPDPPVPAKTAKPAPPLAGVLDALDPVLARNAAALGILSKWNMALLSGYPEDGSLEGLTAFAKANGFACETLRPTLDQLAAINLPAFVKVAAAQHPSWLALVELDGTDVRLTTGIGETRRFSREAFQPRYLRQAVVLWRDPTPQAPVLMPLTKGDRVRALQESLRSLGRLTSEPSGVYDAATVAAVKQVQAEMGLIVDGKVGKQTRMVLSSWLPEVATPTLSVLCGPALENLADLGAAPESSWSDGTQDTPGLTAAVAPEAIELGNAASQSPESSADTTSPEAEAEPAVEETLDLVPAEEETLGEDGGPTDAPLAPSPTAWSPLVTVNELGEPKAEPPLVSMGPDGNKLVTQPSTGSAPLVPHRPGEGGEKREERL